MAKRNDKGYLCDLAADDIAARAKAAAAANGFLFWEKGDYNINCIGIRNPDDQAAVDAFNDAMLWLWKEKGLWQYRIFKITTDPGQPSVKAPRRTDGTARIVFPQQIRRMWVLGEHHGSSSSYPAGRMFAASADVAVWRVHGDLDSGSVYYNAGGLNYHRASANKQTTVIGPYSEGCQVNSDPLHFAESLRIWGKQIETWGEGGKYLSYTGYEPADATHPLWPILQATI